MSMNNSSNKQSSESEPPSGKDSATVISDPQNAPHQRLTQIGQQLKAQHSNAGFIQAKRDANKALADNKIILNSRFVLESTIGTGGMGTVFKAQDLRKVEARDTNPYVAIKVLSGDFKQHPDAFIALQREASRSSSLAHPNIVTVHDFDRDGDSVYMTMELLQGDDLYSLMEKHADSGLPKALAMNIITDYCQALSYAHEKGVIHCDLKPANIFVTEQGAKVLDFGIARLAIQTQDHFDAGKMNAFTPGYASLEMFNRDDPDPSDDVFAAAVIAYELLSGKHPYDMQPAPVALALGKQPKPIQGLNHRESKAILGALQLKKSDRTPTIKAFLEALKGKPKRTAVKAAAAIAAFSITVMSYMNYLSDNELEQKIHQTITQAKQCLQLKDYPCAIRHADVVLNIQPDHSEANQLLNSAHIAFESHKKQVLIESLQTASKQCFDQADWQCAKEKSEQLQKLDPSNFQAMEFLNTIAQRREQEDRIYWDHRQKSESCLIDKKYACAISYAEQALQIRSNDEPMLTIKQQAIYALEQDKQALSKAKSIVNDGIVCFKKFDYSCAIAKAEVALELVPKYTDALKLKTDAQKAVQEAKKAITIQ